MKRLIAIVVAVMVAASASVFAQQKAFSIVTGTTGGVYFPLGGGLAQILTKHAGINANVEATAGSAENMFRIARGQADIAFSQTDAAWDAYNGLDKFSGNKVGVRALMVLYPNTMHLVTIDGTGINTIADLRGKRVSTGPANSATEIMAVRALQAVAVWNILAVRDDMPVDVAYNITRATYQNRADLALVHPEGRNLDTKWQLNGAAVIPFHPGAMKFWAEQGVKLK